MSKWLISGDLHLRQTPPRCRKDPDWIGSQRSNLETIRELAILRKCSHIILTGDLFHVAKATNRLVNLYLEVFKANDRFAEAEGNPELILLAGNHDLPFHSENYLEDSAIGTLFKKFRSVIVMSDYSFPKSYKFIHTLCLPSDKERPVPGVGITAQELLDQHPDCRGIFTGDYHRSFHYVAPDGRFVLNPGCINIQVADMIDYIPKVAIFDTITEKVEWIQIEENPIEFVDTMYLDSKKMKEGSMGKFIEILRTNSGISLDFVSNLEQKMLNTNLSDNTRKTLNDVLSEL